MTAGGMGGGRRAVPLLYACWGFAQTAGALH
jgi:hypothetical protein